MANRKDDNRNRENDGKMTLEEAGHKGGEATSKNHDREFYEEIGQKGGEARLRNRDSDSGSNSKSNRSQNKDDKK